MRKPLLALCSLWLASCGGPTGDGATGGDGATDGGGGGGSDGGDSGVVDSGTSDGGTSDDGVEDSGTGDGGSGDDGVADSGSADPCGGVAVGVEVGACAHDFELTDQYGTTWQLHAQAGKVVMLDFSGYT